MTLFSPAGYADKLAVDPTNMSPKVKLETSLGVIIVELDRAKAPITVDNFLSYVVTGDYNNTIFHRLITHFIVQGGGYDADLIRKKVQKDITNESDNGLKNTIGTIAMARQNQPHTANRQFFFNINNNTNLDHGRSFGYTVFGKVVEGIEVLKAFTRIKTHYNEELGLRDVPQTPIVLIKATLLTAQK